MLLETQVRDLIAAGETFTVEFKEETRAPLNDHDLVMNVVCLANGRGGVLLVGVEDDGTITGAMPRHQTVTDPRRVEALVANRTVPSVPVLCQVLRINGFEVLAIEIPAMETPVSTKSGVFKRRAIGSDSKPACIPFHFHEMQAVRTASSASDYSALKLHQAGWEDLDPLEFERLRQTILLNPGRADRSLLALANDELVRSLGLGSGGEGTGKVENLNVAAILLLGREDTIRRLIPTHEAAFQVLQGTRVAVNDFFRGSLIRIAEEFGNRFDARNDEEETAIDSVSVGIPNYSREGFREALHNALIHRDYSERGAIHVQWRTNQIEISNPGGFVEGVGVENLLVTAPKPRNPVLADAFKRIGLVERTGRGIDRIYEGQLRYGRPAPDYSRSSDRSVQVVLHGGPANLALARWFIQQATPERPVYVEDMIIVNAVEQERWVNAEHMSRLLQRGDTQARGLLERLVERGILEARDTHRRGRVYGLSAAAYRALDKPQAYARGRDFEPIQHEQMVLQYVTAHGRIARSEAADLCQIDKRDATTLLTGLVKKKKLVLRGQKRGSYYELPSGDLFSS